MLPSNLRKGPQTIGAALMICHALWPFSAGRAEESPSGVQAPQIWTCSYVASTPQGPLQIIAKFQVVGQELAAQYRSQIQAEVGMTENDIDRVAWDRRSAGPRSSLIVGTAHFAWR
jgi:hypothetical protein